MIKVTYSFWRPGQIPGEYNVYRVPKTDAEKRDAEDICPEEVANAIKQVAKEQISISKDELIRETAKMFGFARIGSNVEQAMVRGMNHGS